MSWEVPAGGSGTVGFTCTGLSLDANGEDLIIADPDLTPYERIVKTNRAGAYLGEIVFNTSPGVNDLQGVAYDSSRGHYWAAFGNSGKFARYNASGVQQVIYDSGLGSFGPNGMAYDAANDRVLMVWADNNMRGYAAGTGTLAETLAIADFAGSPVDGLELDPADGNVIWVATDGPPCKVTKVNRTTGATILSWTSPNNAEDIAILGTNLYMAIDQKYHSTVPNGNRVWKFVAATGEVIHTAPVFPPDMVSPTGTMAWWKADQISGNDGDAIGTWSDQSGVGYDLTQGTAGFKPLLKKAANGINGNNVLRFAGDDDSLVRATSSILRNKASATMFIVQRLANTSQDATVSFNLSINASASSRAGLYAGVGNGLFTLRGRRLDADTPVNIGGSALTTGVKLISALWDWTNTTVTIFEEGTQTGTNTSFQTSGNTEDATSLEMAVGAASSSSGPCAVDIAEIIVYVPKLTVADRQRVEWYLAEKYAISGPINPDLVLRSPYIAYRPRPFAPGIVR